MSVLQAMETAYAANSASLGSRSGTRESAVARLGLTPYFVGRSLPKVVFEECSLGWIVAETVVVGSFPTAEVEHRAVAIAKRSPLAAPIIERYRSSGYPIGIPDRDILDDDRHDEVALTSGEAISNGSTYYFVPSQGGWQRKRRDDGLGKPEGNVIAASTTPGSALRAEYPDNALQLFQHGALVLRDRRMYVISGAFYRIWRNGYAWLGLGLPQGDAYRLEVAAEQDPAVNIGRIQVFDNGSVVDPEGWSPFGVLRGLLIDETADSSNLAPDLNITHDYTLELLDIKVVEESGPNGWILGNNEDELRLLLAFEFSDGEKDITRIESYNKGVDQAETYVVNKTLYQGPLPAYSLLSVLGIEEDNETEAKRLLAEFKRVIEEESFATQLFGDLKTDAPIGTFPEEYYYGAVAAGAAIGAIAYASTSVTYTYEAIDAAGRVVASGTATGSGAGLGGAYGAAIAALAVAVVNIVVTAVTEWEPPDPLMVGSQAYFGPELVRSIAGGQLPPEQSARFKTFDDYNIQVRSRFERGTGAGELIQTLDYDVDDGWARYRMRLAHRVGR